MNITLTRTADGLPKFFNCALTSASWWPVDGPSGCCRWKGSGEMLLLNMTVLPTSNSIIVVLVILYRASCIDWHDHFGRWVVTPVRHEMRSTKRLLTFEPVGQRFVIWRHVVPFFGIFIDGGDGVKGRLDKMMTEIPFGSWCFWPRQILWLERTARVGGMSFWTDAWARYRLSVEINLCMCMRIWEWERECWCIRSFFFSHLSRPLSLALRRQKKDEWVQQIRLTDSQNDLKPMDTVFFLYMTRSSTAACFSWNGQPGWFGATEPKDLEREREDGGIDAHYLSPMRKWPDEHIVILIVIANIPTRILY